MPISSERAGGDAAEIRGRRPGKEQAPGALGQGGLPGDATLELVPAAANQVVPDVGLARIRGLHVNLAGALDALQCEEQLAFAGGRRQVLHGMAVAIAAAEVHPAVDARRVALQHLLDQAHALEELTPVEGRNQAQAANQVRHAGLFRGLVLAFGADGALDGLTPLGQGQVELAMQCRCRRAVRARALEQARNEPMVDVLGPEVG